MKKIVFLLCFIALCFQNVSFSSEVHDEMYYKRQIQNQRFLYSNGGLMTAIKKNNVTIVEAFMKAGFNPNDSMGGTPFLIYSIYFNSPESARVLLEAGANPEVTIPPMFVTPRSTNALLYAITKKNSLIVKYLIENHVDVNKTYSGKYPLNFAIKKKQTKIVEMLLKAGAKPDDKTKQLVSKSKDEYLKSLFSE